MRSEVFNALLQPEREGLARKKGIGVEKVCFVTEADLAQYARVTAEAQQFCRRPGCFCKLLNKEDLVR